MKFIFEVTLREGYSAEQYADAWVRASRLIQQAPGARGTRLHRKLGDDRKLLAIASWASKEQRDAMEGQPRPDIAAIIRSAAPFVEISVLGEYEDPEWVVVPDDSRSGAADE